jgi:acyl-CoA reductase-like NAD-dependent aldehyde dehydrogenase
MSGRDRGNVLWKIGDLIQKRAEELVSLEPIDMGKTVTALRTIDIPDIVNTFKYFAGWASKLEGSVKPVSGDFHTYSTPEPLGVVACITPFNFPSILSVHKFAPALACGNTIVHKPAEKTPLGAIKLAEIIHEAGMPAGAFNVINGDGAELGDAISLHKGIEKIAFTGSTKVGKGIVQKSADTLKHVTMELGGKSPHILCAFGKMACLSRSQRVS